MDIFSIITILIVLSAIFGYINVRFLKLPDTIGLMVIAILFTLGVLTMGLWNESIPEMARSLMLEIDFSKVLLEVMLSFLGGNRLPIQSIH